jgi:head-tail adaptor
MVDEFAGTLSERVAIEAWVPGRDAYGAEAGHWQLRGAAAAAVAPDTRGAAVGGEARRSGRRWRVGLRAPPRLDLMSRLIWQGRVLRVLAVDSDPRQPDRQQLVCEEQAP